MSAPLECDGNIRLHLHQKEDHINFLTDRAQSSTDLNHDDLPFMPTVATASCVSSAIFARLQDHQSLHATLQLVSDFCACLLEPTPLDISGPESRFAHYLTWPTGFPAFTFND